jgi:hypothetical protein
MVSYIGIVKAEKSVLVGGVTVHKSSRFTTEKDASRWCESCIKVNRDARRYPDGGCVIESNLPPEIDIINE